MTLFLITTILLIILTIYYDVRLLILWEDNEIIHRSLVFNSITLVAIGTFTLVYSSTFLFIVTLIQMVIVILLITKTFLRNT
jgi:hypothetical protein